jgi:DNA-binding transcriptional regulator YiaG
LGDERDDPSHSINSEDRKNWISSTDIDTSTAGGQIHSYRIMRGLSPKEFGVLIQVDASTVRYWEKAKYDRPKRKRGKIEKIIKQRGS